MDKYLIFFDIDGTLLDEKEHVVPKSTIQALREARDQGHQTFICTGRCKAIWPEDILDIGFDGVVGGCGTHIIYHDEELLHATLDTKLARQIADDLINYHIDGVLEGAVHNYFREDPWIDTVKNIIHENSFFAETATDRISSPDPLEFDKMALWYDDSSDMAGFKAKYEDRFDFIQRDPTFMEIVPKGYSKATGIDFICKTLGVPRSHTMSFGDSTNDLPMLEFTAISVAMGSGNPAIFDSVDFVTDAVMSDGIRRGLEKFHII